MKVLSLLVTFSMKREAALKEYPTFSQLVSSELTWSVMCPYYRHSCYNVVLAGGCCMVKDNYYNRKYNQSFPTATTIMDLYD